MSIEAPVRVDLAQDNPWEATNLTQEEKNYLQEQFTEERNEVLYLTRQELAELSRIIETQNDDRIDRPFRDALQGDLEEFIENQNGLSLSDLLGEESERFNIVEEIAEQMLFNEEIGAMAGLELADRPKRYLTTALSLSIIKQIHQHEDSVSVLENRELIIAEIGSGLEDLQVLSRLRDDLPNGGTHPRISLQDNGEQNAICMNIMQGRDFFNQLLGGELNQDSIRDTLHAANTSETIEAADISELSSESQRLLRDILSRIETSYSEGDNDTRDAAAAIADAVDEAETPEERKTLLDLLAEFIQALGDALKGMLDGTAASISRGRDGNIDTPTDTGEARKTLSPELLAQMSELSSVQLGGLNAQRLRGSLDNSETQIQMREILEGLIPEKNLEQTIEHLFSGEETRFSQFTRHLRNNQFPALTNTEGGTTPISQFRAILEEYGRYRMSEGVAGVGEGRTRWEDYSRSRNEAGWESDES